MQTLFCVACPAFSVLPLTINKYMEVYREGTWFRVTNTEVTGTHGLLSWLHDVLCRHSIFQSRTEQ